VERWEDGSGVEMAGVEGLRWRGGRREVVWKLLGGGRVEVERWEEGSGVEMAGGEGLRWRGGRREVVWKWLGGKGGGG